MIIGVYSDANVMIKHLFDLGHLPVVIGDAKQEAPVEDLKRAMRSICPVDALPAEPRNTSKKGRRRRNYGSPKFRSK